MNRPGTRVAILLDIDGTLIVSGGAGASSWALAFDELYGIAADIGEFTDTGMTDPEVGRKTFEAVLDREPSQDEFAKLLERREHYLHRTVAESDGYRVLPGVDGAPAEAARRRATCSASSPGTSRARRTSSSTAPG